MFERLRNTLNPGAPARAGGLQLSSANTARTHDDQDTVKWFRKTAEKGSAWGQYNLGLRYLQGDGVEADPAAGVQWLERAAEQGHGQAQYQLGRARLEGVGGRPTRWTPGAGSTWPRSRGCVKPKWRGTR